MTTQYEVWRDIYKVTIKDGCVVTTHYVKSDWVDYGGHAPTGFQWVVSHKPKEPGIRRAN